MKDGRIAPPLHGPLTTMVNFHDLIDRYQRHCDDSWERGYGLKLETLDNPGGLLSVGEGQSPEAAVKVPACPAQGMLRETEKIAGLQANIDRRRLSEQLE